MIGTHFSRDILPLGFGCAWLSDGRNADHSLQLIDTAYDAGIQYFDVARMYMGGEAERVLGKFLPKHRDNVIITSKAGIIPLTRSRAGHLAHRVARRLGLLKQESWRDYYRFGAFDIPSLKKSVDDSLRELNIDYLDALLLHEADDADIADGTVLKFLTGLRANGKIKNFGFASTRDQTERLIKKHANDVSIVQTASTVLRDGVKPLIGKGNFLTITHSVLAEALDKITKHLTADETSRTKWSQHLALDLSNRESVAEILLAEALDANQHGIVLFSTKSPARIKRAAQIARERPYTQDQISGLRELAAQIGA